MTIQEINFQPMLQWISEQLGIEVELSVEFIPAGHKLVKIVCPNLQEHGGIFRTVVSEAMADFF